MAEEKGFLEKILGENIADKIDRGFVSLLGGSNLLGPSLSDYDDAVQQLEEMGMSAEDIIDMVDEIITDNPDTALDLLTDMVEDFKENQSIDRPDTSLQEQKLKKLIKKLVKEWQNVN